MDLSVVDTTTHQGQPESISPLSVPRRAFAATRNLIPGGQTLPREAWRQRHRALLVVLWFHAFALPAFGIMRGYGVLHSLVEGMALVVIACLALLANSRPRLASALVSAGLVTSSAILVHLSDGYIEAHFHFFVVIVLITLYEDWVPLLLAAAYTGVHHGLLGTIDPASVYNHPDAIAHPWKWAAIHAGFVGAATLAAVGAWRLNEGVRAETREAYRRAAESEQRFARQALQDQLTGLSNRRKLLADLEEFLAEPEEREAMLLLFDLDGFKAYNDTFGHPAGDALLTRLAQRLDRTMQGRGHAYRMGGDEFCVLTLPGSIRSADLPDEAVASLEEHGDGFRITASHGSVLLPTEAGSAPEALGKADQRMYARKNSRRHSAQDQITQALVTAVHERSTTLWAHMGAVAELCDAVAAKLGLPDSELTSLRQAASLHDIGKLAIPDAILNKPGPLLPDEWEFIRAHTLIGERIVGAAPALRSAAKLIRSSHERHDGRGYPDQLAGADIPLSARIVAVCDAYDVMTSARPYSDELTEEAALAELFRCAGTQFDPVVVEAFCAVHAEAAASEPLNGASASAA